MCGRFYLDTLPDEAMEHFTIRSVPTFEVSYNVAPSQAALTVRNSKEGDREAVLLRWGLIPFWAKDPKIGYKMINARSETAAEKPAFRAAWKKRRCLVAVSGFYEWCKQPEGPKQPYAITLKEQSVFAIAGLWESWRDADGNPLETCTLLTTEPNILMQDIHNRMPVILDPENFDAWLGGTPDEAAALMQSYDPEKMTCWPISTAVNKPANNYPELLEVASAA